MGAGSVFLCRQCIWPFLDETPREQAGIAVCCECPGIFLTPWPPTAIIWDGSETQTSEERGNDASSNVHAGDFR